MDKKVIIGIVVLALVVGGGVWALTGRNNDKNNSNSMGNMNMSKSSDSNSSNTPVATNTVAIQNFAFSPANITVKKGTTVTWTNKDVTPHTVTQDDGTTISSKSLAQNDTYTVTFDTAGTFKYHCSFHSTMTGTVTVTD